MAEDKKTRFSTLDDALDSLTESQRRDVLLALDGVLENTRAYAEVIEQKANRPDQKDIVGEASALRRFSQRNAEEAKRIGAYISSKLGYS
jgi:hypothetical protein